MIRNVDCHIYTDRAGRYRWRVTWTDTAGKARSAYTVPSDTLADAIWRLRMLLQSARIPDRGTP